jgi:hypothetical protein
MPQEPAEFDDLPDALAADLARIYRADVRPSPAADQAVLNRARAHFAGRKRVLLLRRVAGAAAAVILIAAVLIPAFHRTDHGMAIGGQETRGDLNVDGTVDIRDALALARRIEAKSTKPTNDYNGDRIVDRRDVDALAMMAVRLDSDDKGRTPPR